MKIYMFKKTKRLRLILLSPLLIMAVSLLFFSFSGHAAADPCNPDSKGNPVAHCCGSNPQTQISINIGCKSKGNPIMDATFGIIRFLSDGVGIVVVASTVYAGIQYSSSRGDPNASAQAIKRIQSNVIALLIFIFGYALLNYVIPGTFLTSTTPTSTSQGTGS